jgi:hypothetical protein
MLNAEHQTAIPEPGAKDLTTDDRVRVAELRGQVAAILKNAT